MVSLDIHEKTWNPPMPLLLQRRLGTENRPINGDAVRVLLDSALAHAGLAGPSGQPLKFQPHDFRRLFITDAVMSGMPPHIAQLVVGHRDVNTTMGYKAIYPEEVINGHRAFITRAQGNTSQRGVPDPDRRGMGRVPRPFRTAESRPRGMRPGLRVSLHP